MSRNSTAQSMFITKKSSSMRAPVIVCRGSARVRNSAYLSFGRGTFSGTATVVLLLIIPRHPVYAYIASFYSIYVSSSFLLSLSLSLSLYPSTSIFIFSRAFVFSRTLSTPLFSFNNVLPSRAFLPQNRSIRSTPNARPPTSVVDAAPKTERRHIIYRLCVTA